MGFSPNQAKLWGHTEVFSVVVQRNADILYNRVQMLNQIKKHVLIVFFILKNFIWITTITKAAASLNEIYSAANKIFDHNSGFGFFQMVTDCRGF